MTKARNRNRRSEKLTPKEHQAFKNYVKSFDTKYDASIEIGVSTVTLDAVLLKGSGKPRTIELIREKLKPTEDPGEEIKPEKERAIA